MDTRNILLAQISKNIKDAFQVVRSALTSGYLPVADDDGLLVDSVLYCDNTYNRIGVNTDSPQDNIDVRSTLQVANSNFAFNTDGSNLRVDFSGSGNVDARIQAGITGGAAAGGISLNPYGGTVSIGANVDLKEITEPSSPAANHATLYLDDNGSGKTRLMVKFATGASIQLATQA
jgi:hypothetical protein